MLFLRSWLEEYINLDGIDNEKLLNAITQKSSEVEGYTHLHDYFGGLVVVGKIENLRKHPNADRLNIFDVNIGQRSVQIVSAAPNVKSGMLVPVALEAAVLPDMTIVTREMRGEKSYGMCCGKSELLLEEGFSDGLWALDCSDENIGKAITEVYPDLFQEEFVFDIKVLPDKYGNISNYIGMSMEIAKVLEDTTLLKGLAKSIWNGDDKAILSFKDKININYRFKFQDNLNYTDAYYLFDTKFDTKEYFLPAKYKKRLFLTQINMVGGLTDLSNYLLYDLGQPSHYFSKEKIDKDDTNILKIEEVTEEVVFKGLGQLKKKKLTSGVRVMNNEAGPIIIPGISGSKNTSMDLDETESYIEIANFNKEEVARNNFRLKYRSDGGKVWAGGVTKARIAIYLAKFFEILEEQNLTTEVELCLSYDRNYLNDECCGADCVDCEQSTISDRMEELSLDDTFDLFTSYLKPKIYPINYNYISQKLDNSSVDVWEIIIDKHLPLLGKHVGSNIAVNSAYSNVSGQESLLTEVASSIGTDILRPNTIKAQIYTEPDKDFQIVKWFKVNAINFGYDEIITRPFVSSDYLINEKTSLRVLKPQNVNLNYLRDNMLFTILESATKNLQSSEKNIRIFESNRIYENIDGITETKSQVLLSIDPNKYEVTNFVISTLNQIEPNYDIESGEVYNLQNEVNGLATFYIGKTIIITILQVSNKLKKKFNIPFTKRVFVVNIDYTKIKELPTNNTKYKDQSQYPGLSRDYTFDLVNQVYFSDVFSILKSDNELEVEITPVDMHNIRGGNALTININFSSESHTLESKDVEEWYLNKEKLLKKAKYIK